MPRSLEPAKGTTLARKQSGHGMQISSEDFTVNAVCTTLPFVLKYEDSGSLEKSSGTALFYLYDKYYAYQCVISFSPSGTGFDQSTRGLAALYYEMLPAAGQVMCWHLSRLLPEAAARRATVWWVGERQKGCPHEKWLRIQSMCIVQAGFPPL